jgi:hypothetical protein
MKKFLRYLALSGLVASSAACGSKGDGSVDDEMDTDGSGGTSSTDASGGTGGGAGGPVEAELQYGFDADLEGWDYNYSSSAPDSALIQPSEVDVSWNEEDGDPGGAFQAYIEYAEAGQYVGFGINLDPGIDLTGRIITADIMLVEGVGDAEDLMTNPAGAKLYAKAGETYVYNAGYFENVTVQAEWIRISFNLGDPGYEDAAAGTFDPTDIREIGVQFDTGGSTTTAQPGTWLLDNISW